jgi:aldehyde dehydrogenase (NAD+)
MEIAQEEVFGPVLALMPYHDEDQALEFANSTPYGLSGAVWAADAHRAQAFAQQMKTGQVILNGAPQNLATPFGGWGWSGFGRENGRFGIEDLLNYRALHGAP